MPDAPWRCSECGTVNEPVANSCRTCGRWPSLFDLQESVFEEAQVEDRRYPGNYFPEPEPVEPAPFDPREPFEVEPIEPEPTTVRPYEVEPVGEAEEEPDGSGRRRTLTSLIVPIAFAIYIIVSIVFGDR